MPEPRTILVTGATGFLGSHVVDALLEAGQRVRCLIRATSALRWLHGKEVETVVADLGGRLEPAVDGVDAVIHCAGLTRGSARALNEANVEGTRALLQACVAAGGRPRFVLCSSQAAAGPGQPERPRRPQDPPAPNSAYGRSKLAAEEAVRRRADDLPGVIMRPAAVYGPRDEDTLPFFRMAARGIVPVPGTRRLVQLVHARDVAAALWLGVQRPAPGGRAYFVADPRALGWGELTRAIGRALGRQVLAVPLPGPFFSLAGALTELAGAAKRPGALDRRRARDLIVPAWTCDVESTFAELGWRPSYDLEAGLSETVAWYREAGWL